MITALVFALYILAGVQVTNPLVTIARIGKERKPSTPADAITAVVVNGVFAAVLVLAAMHLRGS